MPLRGPKKKNKIADVPALNFQPEGSQNPWIVYKSKYWNPRRVIDARGKEFSPP